MKYTIKEISEAYNKWIEEMGASYLKGFISYLIKEEWKNDERS